MSLCLSVCQRSFPPQDCDQFLLTPASTWKLFRSGVVGFGSVSRWEVSGCGRMPCRRPAEPMSLAESESDGVWLQRSISPPREGLALPGKGLEGLVSRRRSVDPWCCARFLPFVNSPEYIVRRMRVNMSRSGCLAMLLPVWVASYVIASLG